MAALDKDPAILAALDRLRSRLGSNAFVITDNWELDLCAVGIASPHDPGVLVYISTYGEPPGRFGYELELPRRPVMTSRICSRAPGPMCRSRSWRAWSPAISSAPNQVLPPRAGSKSFLEVPAQRAPRLLSWVVM